MNSFAKKLCSRCLIGFWINLHIFPYSFKVILLLSTVPESAYHSSQIVTLISKLVNQISSNFENMEKINILKPAFVSAIRAGLTYMSPLPYLYLRLVLWISLLNFSLRYLAVLLFLETGFVVRNISDFRIQFFLYIYLPVSHPFWEPFYKIKRLKN